MNMVRKISAIFFALTLVASTLPAPAFAAGESYSDVPSHHWANAVIAKWSGDGYGVLQGNGNGTFAPSRGITLGELATILSKTFGYTERASAEVTPAWADEAVEKAIAAGVVAQSATLDASVAVTREQAIKYMAIAYGVAPVAGETTFADNAAIGDAYKPYVNAFQKLGYIVGKGNGVFDPQANYTRAEALQAIENTTSEILDKSAGEQTYAKNLIIRASGVTLKDATAQSNLIVGQGVGDGEVTLDNVKIGGTLIAYGGGENSINVKGGETVASTLLNKPYGEAVRLDGDFDTIAVAGGTKAILTGKVAKLILSGNNEITLKGAALSGAEINGADVKLIAGAGDAIDNVTVNASKVVLSGSGTVKNVGVTENAKEGVEVLTAPTEIVVDAGAGAVKTRNGTVQPGETATTTPVASGGSSSGGSDRIGYTPPSDPNAIAVSLALNYEGADAPSKQFVTAGQKLAQPETPVRIGYTFDGWYKEAACENAFDFDAAEITEALTLYAKWTKVAGPVSIVLEADKTEILSAGQSSEIHFYAALNQTAPVVRLLSGDGTELATMKDDGMYTQSGDDLKNDGVYSCKLQVPPPTTEEPLTYKATDGTTVSNELSLRVIAALTQEETENIEKVDTAVYDLFGSDAWAALPEDDKVTSASAVLTKMVTDGLIEEGSLSEYDEDSQMFTYLYESGVIGGTYLGEWPGDENGGAAIRDESYAGDDAAPVQTFASGDALDASVGDAIVLWAFDQEGDNETFRKPFYEDLEEDWDAAGLNTSVDWDVTVADFKNLKGYEVIVFSGHGSYYTFTQYTGFLEWASLTAPALVLSEESTKEKDKAYSADLKQFRIGKLNVKGGTVYTVFPGLFAEHKESGALDGSLVFSESCEFYGKDNEVNDAMSAAMLGASDAVVGFHNSVRAEYSRKFMKLYVDELIKGATAGEAFLAAESVYGANDGVDAYPILSGNPYASLFGDDLKNPDFEDASHPKYWNGVGDVRVISALGNVVPQSGSRMGLLTTGIGSKQDEYLSGTEGSVLSQKFRVPNDVSTLTLQYDYISEEPLEFVGTIFDDTLAIQLFDGAGKLIETLATETINQAQWKTVGGINFDGGDSTAYHTGWKTVKVDVSAYRGQAVTLRCVVYDKGDSIYDSAAAIDAITLN
ncbi:MAG: S-layer homology domain-containing protein [Clostridiales Family XIII bacterium]|jgi:uncharacterized repeat protein (TIGR02543 family)|nr:S-layer homology domain-containing protein [Clostridiales Family XIII bacterium]